MRRIAVLAPAGIGDTMRLTPALRQLGRSDPNVSVTLYTAAGRGSDEVMAGVTPVDRHVPIPFLGKSKDKFNHLVWDLRHNCPDQLVSTWSSRLAGLASFFSGAKQRCGWVPQWALTMKLNKLFLDSSVNYQPLRKNVGLYDTLTFAKLLGLGELTMEAPSFSAPIWEENALIRARERLEDLAHPILIVNAVAQASIQQRQYPLHLMALVLEELLAQEVVQTVVLVGDSYSRSCHGPLKRVIGSRGLDLSGELSLTATAAMIQECDVALSIDGGLLHVALASTLPVVALYGPTEIYSVDPRGIPGRYAKISAFGDCRCICQSHCGIQIKPECRDQSQCLASIPPASIVEAVSTLLGQKPSFLEMEEGSDKVKVAWS